jgi:hypothetical protein
MLPQNVRALVVAFYLSRHDHEAYAALGFGNVGKTHGEVARRLGVKETTLKHMRDEFDGHTDNSRAGWYQSPLSRSRLAVAHLLGEMDEPDLRAVVLGLLGAGPVEGIEVIEAVTTYMPEGSPDRSYRHETGRRAEEVFQGHHARTGLPVAGTLRDRRDQEAGYDFEIERGGAPSVYVEVKGVRGRDGGLQFTGREWATATREGTRYVLALVTEVGGVPEVLLLADPARVLAARQRLEAVLRVRYDVGSSDVRRAVGVDGRA